MDQIIENQFREDSLRNWNNSELAREGSKSQNCHVLGHQDMNNGMIAITLQSSTKNKEIVGEELKKLILQMLSSYGKITTFCSYDQELSNEFIAVFENQKSAISALSHLNGKSVGNWTMKICFMNDFGDNSSSESNYPQNISYFPPEKSNMTCKEMSLLKSQSSPLIPANRLPSIWEVDPNNVLNDPKENLSTNSSFHWSPEKVTYDNSNNLSFTQIQEFNSNPKNEGVSIGPRFLSSPEFHKLSSSPHTMHCSSFDNNFQSTYSKYSQQSPSPFLYRPSSSDMIGNKAYHHNSRMMEEVPLNSTYPSHAYQSNSFNSQMNMNLNKEKNTRTCSYNEESKVQSIYSPPYTGRMPFAANSDSLLLTTQMNHSPNSFVMAQTPSPIQESQFIPTMEQYYSPQSLPYPHVYENYQICGSQRSLDYRNENNQPVDRRKSFPEFSGRKALSNIIYPFEIINGKDKRTTLMIRNIPNKITQDELFQVLRREFTNQFDYLYLPKSTKKENAGYGFINFIHELFILPFYFKYHESKFKVFNSEKICTLTYGHLQGKLEHISQDQHYKAIIIENIPIPNGATLLQLKQALMHRYGLYQ